MSKVPEVQDLDTLKAWCHWRRKGLATEANPIEGEVAFVKTVEDLISQVGTFRAERDKARGDLFLVKQQLARAEERAAKVTRNAERVGICGCPRCGGGPTTAECLGKPANPVSLEPATTDYQRGYADALNQAARAVWADRYEPPYFIENRVVKMLHEMRDMVSVEPTRPVEQFTDFLDRKAKWSNATFGPGARYEGVCKHIEKELAEIRKEPGDLAEWVDVTLLALDGAQRAGFSPEQIWAAMQAKQRINEARKWPPPGAQDQAVEHVKE